MQNRLCNALKNVIIHSYIAGIYRKEILPSARSCTRSKIWGYYKDCERHCHSRKISGQSVEGSSNCSWTRWKESGIYIHNINLLWMYVINCICLAEWWSCSTWNKKRRHRPFAGIWWTKGWTWRHWISFVPRKWYLSQSWTMRS